MIKRIPVRELKPGMFIHDLNCSWVVHPLFLTRFKLENDREIEKIIELGVREVYIDSTLGDDLPDAQTAEEVRAIIERDLRGIGNERCASAPCQVSLNDEVDAAMEVHSHASMVIQGLMTDARMGRQLRLDNIEEAIEGVTGSILRNSSALVQMSRLKSRDNYTFEHSVGVSALLTAFCKTLHLSQDITRQVSIGAILHDIGKMVVPNAILNKPGRLSEMEFDEMKLHVEYGQDLIAQGRSISSISLAVLSQHHERFDGSGYPAALKGNEISPFGQMAAIVDVYDAITAERVYHKAIPAVEAVRKLQEWSKFHFNEELVRHFFRCTGIYPIGTMVKLESGVLGFVIEQSPCDILRPIVRMAYDVRKNWPLTPYDLDLSAPANQSDCIVGYELPERWGIEAAQYLGAGGGG